MNSQRHCSLERGRKIVVWTLRLIRTWWRKNKQEKENPENKQRPKTPPPAQCPPMFECWGCLLAAAEVSIEARRQGGALFIPE